MYHSVSMLLPDGRVLSAGGGRLAPAPDQLNMQMYSPGYLFKGSRPTITPAAGPDDSGSTMDLVTPQAADIAKVSLVSLGSITHTADWNQRFVDLSFTRTGNTLTVDAPANANIAPANYYMVFAVDSNGVPSVARIVQLRGRPGRDTAPPTGLDDRTARGRPHGRVALAADARGRRRGHRRPLRGRRRPRSVPRTPRALHGRGRPPRRANGAHAVRAVARDAAGNTTTSAPVASRSTTAPTPHASSLVGAWSFNQGTGTTAPDGSGRGNTGTLRADLDHGGQVRRCPHLRRRQRLGLVLDASSLDLGASMTLEAWVRPTASSGWRTVLLKETPTGLAYSLYSASNTNRPSAWLDGTSAIGSAAVPLNTWSHLSATYNGSRLRLYVNGVLRSDKATTTAVPASGNPLKIGGNAVWGEWFAGQIDEVRVYDRVLTAAEIAADMNAPQ